MTVLVMGQAIARSTRAVRALPMTARPLELQYE